MAYEYERINNIGCVTSPISTDQAVEELQEVYRKAKAMGEIEQAYWKSDTPENFAYDFVRIFEKHFSNGVEGADDER